MAGGVVIVGTHRETRSDVDRTFTAADSGGRPSRARIGREESQPRPELEGFRR